MKVAIVGSRHFDDYETLERFVLAKIPLAEISQVISGGAAGADALAAAFARRHNLWLREFPAEWGRFGRAAGPQRNRLIVEAAEVLVAFPLGPSAGTRDCIRKARAKGILVHVLELPPPIYHPGARNRNPE